MSWSDRLFAMPCMVGWLRSPDLYASARRRCSRLTGRRSSARDRPADTPSCSRGCRGSRRTSKSCSSPPRPCRRAPGRAPGDDGLEDGGQDQLSERFFHAGCSWLDVARQAAACDARCCAVGQLQNPASLPDPGATGQSGPRGAAIIGRSSSSSVRAHAIHRLRHLRLHRRPDARGQCGDHAAAAAADQGRARHRQDHARRGGGQGARRCRCSSGTSSPPPRRSRACTSTTR